MTKSGARRRKADETEPRGLGVSRLPYPFPAHLGCGRQEIIRSERKHENLARE